MSDHVTIHFKDGSEVRFPRDGIKQYGRMFTVVYKPGVVIVEESVHYETRRRAYPMNEVREVEEKSFR